MTALLLTSSCTSLHKTATTETVATEIISFNEADLEVSPKKISFFYKPSRAERRGGEKNAIRCAVSEALKANGNADVLVAPQYVIKKKRGNVKEITVTGYPATYKNFRPAAKTCKK